jgi:hypothetical protein
MSGGIRSGLRQMSPQSLQQSVAHAFHILRLSSCVLKNFFRLQLFLLEPSVCTPCGIALPSLRKAVTKTTCRIFSTELTGLRFTSFRHNASQCGCRQAGLGFSSLIETTRIESSSTKQLGRDRRVSGLSRFEAGSPLGDSSFRPDCEMPR